MSSLNYSSVSTEAEKAKTPILTSIYNFVGGFCLFGAALTGLIVLREPTLLIAATPSICLCILAALVSFGVAQVVMLIARIEFNTRATDSSYQMVKLLNEVARNTAPKGPQPPL